MACVEKKVLTTTGSYGIIKKWNPRRLPQHNQLPYVSKNFFEIGAVLLPQNGSLLIRKKNPGIALDTMVWKTDGHG